MVGSDHSKISKNGSHESDSPKSTASSGTGRKTTTRPSNSRTTSGKTTPRSTSSAKTPEPPKSEIDLLVEKRYPMPIIHPLDQITKNWTAVPANAYPQQIVASEPVAFDLIINGQKAGSTNLPPGTPIRPLQLIGNQLTVASLANQTMRTKIAVEKNQLQTIHPKTIRRFPW